jgi:hypothetical protein
MKIKYLILINNHIFSNFWKNQITAQKITSSNSLKGPKKKEKKKYERRITSSSYYLLHKPQRPSRVS